MSFIQREIDRLGDAIRDFARELEEFREKLGDAGHRPEMRDDGMDAGIKGDFELPYSTLPRLRGEKWQRTEKIAPVDSRAPPLPSGVPSYTFGHATCSDAS